jgi:hypothetical protein
MINPKVRARLRLVVVAGLLLVVGCSPGERVYEVHGRITIDSQPITPDVLSHGFVSFQTESTEGRDAVGAIQQDGTYRLTTNKPDDGAVVGKYKVYIIGTDNRERNVFDEVSTTGLTAEVQPKVNEINFDLKPAHPARPKRK